VKAGHNGQLLHGQLLGGLLVTMATAALDLGTAAEVLWSGEPGEEEQFGARVFASMRTSIIRFLISLLQRI